MRITRIVIAIIASTCVPSCKHDAAVKSAADTPASDTAGIGDSKYAVCNGQGGNPNQLAPAFLDSMDACKQADTAPAATLADAAGDGTIIAGKGDCQFDHGISCHF